MTTKPIRFLLIFTLAATAVFAQRPGGGPGGFGGRMGASASTPEEIGQRRVTFLTRQLTLTDAQQQQALTIFTNAARTASTTRDSLKTAQQALSTAVTRNDIAGIDQAANTIGNLTAQTTSAEAKANAAFYQILTPDQQGKFHPMAGPGQMGQRNRRF